MKIITLTNSIIVVIGCILKSKYRIILLTMHCHKIKMQNFSFHEKKKFL